jgi:bifunctional non-homologous end joining protein LigD
MSKLGAYQAKRDFSKTKEPSGATKVEPSERLRFVIQKHAATRLHYDLRLELDGVFKSWAVTKGPSRDPKERRLAVEVEDHPLDYGDFEGTIPKGNMAGAPSCSGIGAIGPRLTALPHKRRCGRANLNS